MNADKCGHERGQMRTKLGTRTNADKIRNADKCGHERGQMRTKLGTRTNADIVQKDLLSIKDIQNKAFQHICGQISGQTRTNVDKRGQMRTNMNADKNN